MKKFKSKFSAFIYMTVQKYKMKDNLKKHFQNSFINYI